MPHWAWISLVLPLVTLAVHAEPGPAGPPSGPWREQIHWVPMQQDAGPPRLLYTRICRPPGDARAHVVVTTHGATGNSQDRAAMRPPECDGEQARWFLDRGYLLVMGMRRGYGPAAGEWVEGTGSPCTAERFVTGGIEGARDLDAMVLYATALPYSWPDGAVVVGESAGGWAVIAYDSMPHPKVSAFVNVVGGRGGRMSRLPRQNCQPEEIIRAAGLYGQTARTPMLWIYMDNDAFFPPPLARVMRDAFERNGGTAELALPGAYDEEGHGVFGGSGGSLIWGPLLEGYLDRQHVVRPR